MADKWTDAVVAAIEEATGETFTSKSKQPCGGGCINDAWRLVGTPRNYFVKLNKLSALAMFETEARGLEAICETQTIRVPEPITSGVGGERAFLVLEAIDFGSANDSGQAMGRDLAALHRNTGNRFGWEQDNYLGSAHQQNGYMDNWADFFRERRLKPQLEWAAERGQPIHGASTMLDAVGRLLADHKPAPSLLHGDLWGGNAAHDAAGKPVVFDPACYYGDRETDLAFTRMFGGFGPGFYQAYQKTWPLPDGHEQRAKLYNLYHVINHANLFGGGYHSEAEATIIELTD